VVVLLGVAFVDQVAGTATSGTPCVLGDQDEQPPKAIAMANAVASDSVREDPRRKHGDSDFCEVISFAAYDAIEPSIVQESNEVTVSTS
jgi:hypothetical protein